MRLIFILRDVNTTGFDQEKADRMYKKGDLIEILNDGQFAGKKVEPNSPEYDGTFVIVNVPDITREQASAYRKKWKIKLDYEILVSNAQGFRIRAFVTNPGVSGLGNLTKEKIQNVLDRYGGVVKSFAPNEVIFDVSNEDAPDLKMFVKEWVESQTLRKSQFYINESEIDTIIASGGEVTITKATLLTKIRNKLDL